MVDLAEVAVSHRRWCYKAVKEARGEQSRQFSRTGEVKPLLKSTEVLIIEAAGFVSIRLIALALILQMSSEVRGVEAEVQSVPVPAVNFIA